MKTILTAMLLLLGTTAPAVEIHVAPTGNDANPGTAAQPLASLTGARDAIRHLKKQGPLDGPVRVLVAGGEYTLTEPLVLGPEDGGTAQSPISYEAAPGARPVFTGGRTLRGWQQAEGGLWTMRIPEVAEGKWYFEQLFVNGRRATRARTPNRFYLFMQDIDQEVLEGDGRKPKSARQTVRLRPEDYQRAFVGVGPEDLRDLNLVVYHNWDNTRRFLERLDPERSAMVTVGEGMKSWNPWKRNSHFHLENYRAALDAPGEWFLARDGVLSYKPLPNEDMAQATVVAPVVERFLLVQGDPAGGKFVEHVACRGLAFEHGQWLSSALHRMARPSC